MSLQPQPQADENFDASLAVFYSGMRGFLQDLSYAVKNDEQYNDLVAQAEQLALTIQRRIGALQNLTKNAIQQRREAVEKLARAEDDIRLSVADEMFADALEHLTDILEMALANAIDDESRQVAQWLVSEFVLKGPLAAANIPDNAYDALQALADAIKEEK